MQTAQAVAQQDTDLVGLLQSARLPALPQVLLQLMALADRDDVELGRIAAIVNTDSAIAAKIVNVANSAYFNRGRSVSNLHQCLAVIGTNQVRRIALNLSVSSLFANFRSPTEFDSDYFWYHSLSVALTTRKLAQRIGYPHADEAYLAGLLHDVGHLALLAVMPERYLPLIGKGQSEAELCQLEKHQFGMTHAMAGAVLGQKWNLNPLFIDALKYHHEPMDRVIEAHPLVQLLAFSDWLNVADAQDIKPDHPLLSLWQIEPDELKSLLVAVQAEVKTTAEWLGITISDTPRKSGIDPDVQARLADTVSQHLESQGVLPEASPSRQAAALHRGILRSAKILFETAAAALFTEEAGILVGHPAGEEDLRLAEVRIPLSANLSAIVKAYRGEYAVAGAIPQEESLADAQIIHSLGCQRLLCLPLSVDGQCHGVLAIGLTAKVAEEFLRREILLRNFSRAAARLLAPPMAHPAETDEAVHLPSEPGVDMQVRTAIHEVSNPLSVVRNYMTVMREQMASNEQSQQDFDLIENELRRVTRILDKLKTTASPQRPQGARPKAMVDLGALINEVVRLCKIGRPEFQNIDFQLNLEASLPHIPTDADKLKQVLVNLVFNAAEAMPSGGKITLATVRRPSPQGAGLVEISVQDNGPGLPAAIVDNPFKPTQTAKGGSHQGLGLSIVARLIEELGGGKQCNSTATGTTFKIFLPLRGVEREHGNA